MSKVAIVNDAKKQYIHTPIQTVVKVSDTIFTPLLSSKQYDKCHPEPSAMIADCSRLTTQQLFDVIALVKTISPTRSGGSATGRVVFDIEIIDGSMTNDQVRIMPLTVWTDRIALGSLMNRRCGSF